VPPIARQTGKLKEALLEKKALWRKSKAEERLLVDEATIIEIIATMTGIPLSRLEEEESNRLLKLEDELRKGSWARTRPWRRSQRASGAPVPGSSQRQAAYRVVYFLGPTGVGKTELAKTLSVALFNTRTRLSELTCRIYGKIAVSRLVARPPGYVAYEEGGQSVKKSGKSPIR